MNNYNMFMTLRLRNILMIILSVISFIGTVIVIYLFFEGIFSGYPNYLKIIPFLIIQLFSTIYCFIIYFSFRNTTSFEIFFYFLFIFSILFDIFKLDDIFKITENFWSFYPMLTTRLIYYGRFAGTFSLLCSGLFATGLEYQKIGLTAFLSMLMPVILVIVIPVDISIVIPGNTLQIGGHREIFSVLAIISIIAILNFIIAGLKNENKDYFIIAFLLFLSISGRELSFYSNTLILKICGVILLSLNSTLVSHRIHKLYLWY